jgi:hypothetical protein
LQPYTEQFQTIKTHGPKAGKVVAKQYAQPNQEHPQTLTIRGCWAMRVCADPGPSVETKAIEYSTVIYEVRDGVDSFKRRSRVSMTR